MASTEQLRAKLIGKLRELFQLDQPDLDFGFYRIMHAKAKEVNSFLADSLPRIIEQAFGGISSGKKDELQAAYDKAVETARSFGAPDPETAEPVKKARAALEAGKSTANDEAEVYDYLFRFFERYYDNGDFVSLRYLTRETDHKAKPYAIPYGGEEVMLHWANADQYYIKTAENFNTFSFELAQVCEFQEMSPEEKVLKGIPTGLMKVHFKVVDAEEGEHGNVKANEDRFFILRQEQPLDIPDSPDGELTIFFEYRADPEKTGQAGAWKNKRNQEAEATILNLLETWTSSLPDNRRTHPMHGYFAMLAFKPQGDDKESRSILARYLDKYTTKNSSDYFIHKDLGGFLRRELDFYIKNEIMQLDNIENADAPAVESYLGKIRVLRKIAGKLIDFLAQLENFQKKLWLKKKFVVQSDYGITLDRIPEEFYPEIARNLQQWHEWEKLGVLEIKINGNHPVNKPLKKVNDLTIRFEPETESYIIDWNDLDVMRHQVKDSSKQDDLFSGDSKLSICSLFKKYDKLMLDTKFFDADFKAKLLAAIPNLDEQCDGLLLHSENFQALNLLQERYREQVTCIYIDPPYNTEKDRQEGKFIYKDSFEHSTWLTMFSQILPKNLSLMANIGTFFASCDENELINLGKILSDIFGAKNIVETICWNKRIPKNDKGIGNIHEYIYLLSKNFQERRSKGFSYVMKKEAIDEIYEILKNEKNKKTSLEKTQIILKKFYKDQGFDRGITLYCELDQNYEPWGKINMSWPNAKTEGPRYVIINPLTKKPVPIPKKGWRWKEDTFRAAEGNGTEFILPDGSMMKGRIWYAKDEKTQPSSITYLKDVESFLLRSIISLKSDGSLELEDLGLANQFDYPKPSELLNHLLFSVQDNNSLILDYFAGSGTTGHAVINLNREDEGKRKYILVEMGDHFGTVLKPRIEKVAYSPDWKDGKPTTFDNGISHCFKYMRLESYEDTLNNLEFAGGEAFSDPPELHEDYLLHYMLDVETRDSASLLNIRAFADPFSYKLKVKKPGSEESELRTIDLMETFNCLIGLRVNQIFAPQRFSAKFERLPDPELPQDQKTKLTLKGRLHLDAEGKWIFRKVEGLVPKNRFTPNDGVTENVLLIWRVLTDDLEQDNLVLDEFFKRECLNPNDTEFDTIYVNGSNNLPNLKRDGDNWKVRLIEEDFMNRMWEE